MALAAASFHPGLFVSPILFGLFCWPFLVVWVLWAARRPARAGEMARLGLGVSAFALLGCSSGLSWGQGLCLGMAACVPALLFTLRGDMAPPAGASVSETGADRSLMTGGMAAWCPLLVTGCIFMGFLLRPPLAALFFDGLGVVLLACWDGRATRRALPAWEMVRLRLGGVILAGLGLVVMQGGPLFSSNGTAQEVGAVLALAGLGMMAGLGSLASSRAELALLDVGLRSVPLALMPLVAVSPFMHQLMVLAGLLVLGGTVAGLSGRRISGGVMADQGISGQAMACQRGAGQSGRLPLLAWLAGLGMLAAGTGQMLLLLLLYAAALLAMALRLGCERPSLMVVLEGREAMQQGLAALPVQVTLPVIMVVLAGLVPSLGWGGRAGLLLCVLSGFRGVRLGGMSASLLLLWQRGGTMLRAVLLLLGGLSLLAVGLLDRGVLLPGQARPVPVIPTQISSGQGRPGEGGLIPGESKTAGHMADPARGKESMVTSGPVHNGMVQGSTAQTDMTKGKMP